jgi:hypothetical protein
MYTQKMTKMTKITKMTDTQKKTFIVTKGSRREELLYFQSHTQNWGTFDAREAGKSGGQIRGGRILALLRERSRKTVVPWGRLEFVEYAQVATGLSSENRLTLRTCFAKIDEKLNASYFDHSEWSCRQDCPARVWRSWPFFIFSQTYD